MEHFLKYNEFSVIADLAFCFTYLHFNYSKKFNGFEA